VSVATITLLGVSKSFGRQQAVSEVDLVLNAGEGVGLVGHNGAGKSTLIKLMLGLLRPTSGRVSVLGEDPARGVGVRARREIGYLPENVSLYPALTGAETIAFYARLKGVSVKAGYALLEEVGLGKAANRRVGTYSKGMRQRLGLAQALLGRPRALLLDEPTTGLDPALRQQFYEILRQARSNGAAVLLSSHVLTELEGEVDRVVVLNEGRKIADGDLSTLRRNAGIRPRLRARLPQPLSGMELAGWHHISPDVVECVCAEEEIALRLRALPEGASEIDILRPSLDDIYAAFLRHRGNNGLDLENHA